MKGEGLGRLKRDRRAERRAEAKTELETKRTHAGARGSKNKFAKRTARQSDGTWVQVFTGLGSQERREKGVETHTKSKRRMGLL